VEKKRKEKLKTNKKPTMGEKKRIGGDRHFEGEVSQSRRRGGRETLHGRQKRGYGFSGKGAGWAKGATKRTVLPG